MPYTLDTFLKPITDSDKNIQIRDKSLVIKYTINPFTIKNVIVSNNVIKINLNSDRQILIDFRTSTEAIDASTILESNLTSLRNISPLFIDKIIEKYIGSTQSSSTGDITFNSATMSTDSEMDIYLKTVESSKFIISDDGRENLVISGTDSWYRKKGDTAVNNNLLLSGAIICNPYERNSNGQNGWTYLTPGTSSVIDTFIGDFVTAKYLVSCNNISSGDATSCEIIAAIPGNDNNPVISTINLISTNLDLCEFSIRRKNGDMNTIELTSYTEYNPIYVTMIRQYIIYPND